MPSVTAGTDTYGRVKSVGGTPVVTKFAMFHFLPISPLQSYYFSGTGETKTSGIPFVLRSHTVAIRGLPLARLDRASVVMAYIRGICAALTVVGFILAIAPVIGHLSGQRLDEFARIMLGTGVAGFAVGAFGGLSTYAFPLTSEREHNVRKYCGEVLGICADPAFVSDNTAEAIEEYVHEIVPPEPDHDTDLRTALICQLISTRAQVAQGRSAEEGERSTDELLDRLHHLDQTGK